MNYEMTDGTIDLVTWIFLLWSYWTIHDIVATGYASICCKHLAMRQRTYRRNHNSFACEEAQLIRSFGELDTCSMTLLVG